MLIESRFPRYASVYCNITKEQAQKAMKWAKPILDKEIYLPVRLSPTNLLERLEIIHIEKKRLEALYDLPIDIDKDNLITGNFNLEIVQDYFEKQLQVKKMLHN